MEYKLKNVVTRYGVSTSVPSDLVVGELIYFTDLKRLARATSSTTYDFTDKTYVDSQVALKINKIVPITHASLVALRDSASLIPGQQYRITDYTTTTAQPGTQSAGHVFDLIVAADNINKLNEQARATRHVGDTYFANSKLEAWQIWYSLDNDTTRFAWADEENGKGVIYRMIDEWNNDVPYDFKNIKFLRDGLYYYTFTAFENTDETIKDASIMREMAADDMIEGMTNNTMKPYYIYEDDFVLPQVLNFNIFKSYYDDGNIFYMPANNHFGQSCVHNFFDGTEFTLGNTFGTNCQYNTFGNSVSYNSFGNNIGSNSFGNGVSDNSFGNGVNSNSFGNNFMYNTFGNDVYDNSFGNGISNNTFGNTVTSNSFGNGVNSNSFGNNFANNTVKSSVRYVRTPDTAYPNLFQYITLESGLIGASNANKLNLEGIQAVVGYNTPIKVVGGAGTEIASVWQSRTGNIIGLYKNNNLDNSWKTIISPLEGIETLLEGI